MFWILCFGWATFANAYELEQGDTLVFGYSGESHFEVRIFSESSCEKELSCFPINCIPCVREMIIFHDSHLQSQGSERLVKLFNGSSTHLFVSTSKIDSLCHICNRHVAAIINTQKISKFLFAIFCILPSPALRLYISLTIFSQLTCYELLQEKQSLHSMQGLYFKSLLAPHE